MAKVEKWFAQDLKKSVPVRYLDGSFFNEDAAGNRIGVEVYSDGEAVTLAGSITGYCVRPDGTTVPISGVRSSNRAYIDIPQSALAVPGPLTVTIKNTESSVITTLCAVVGIVTQSRTGVQVDPGQTITDWTNQISAQLQAVQTAADNLGSTLAVPYDSLTFPVTAGTYTVYNGNVYRANQDISTSEEWTPSHWTQVKVCNEIYDLKTETTELAEHFPATGKLVAGISTTASANGAVATGVGTTASGRASHAEGQLTTADGQVAHAEGYGTTASGDYSHAEGFGTKASGDHQHAFGKYNVEDTNDTYLELAGNGTGDDARSNARTLDWNGNETLAGDLTVNKGGASEMVLGQEVSSLKSAFDQITEPTKNLFYIPQNPASANHLNIITNTDGSISFELDEGYSTITANTRFNTVTLPAGTYTVTMEKVSGTTDDNAVYLQCGANVLIRLLNGTTPATFTLDADGVIQLCFAKNYGYDQKIKVMLNDGSFALAWTPYGKTAIDLETRAGVSNNDRKISELKESTDDISAYLGVSTKSSGTPAVGIDSKYVYSATMSASSGSLYAISQAIQVEKGDLISVTCAAYNNVVEAISYCDNSLATFRHGIAGTSSTADEVKTYQMFADEDGYVCFSYYKSAGCSYKILNSAMAEYVLEQTDQIETDYQGKEIETFTHGLCIGDSLTQGVFNYDNSGTVDYMVISKYSYPSALSRMTGIEITNKGDGGKTCATWYEVHQNDDLSGHDFCIIQIGVNDISKQEGGWNQVSETALTNIINKVKNENNNIKIYVSTILPTVKTASTRAVSVRIKAVVEGLNDQNVVVVDMESLSHCADKPAYVNGHLTAIGYERLAEDWRNAISYHIKQNPDLYKWVQFIGTEYVGE